MPKPDDDMKRTTPKEKLKDRVSVRAAKRQQAEFDRNFDRSGFDREWKAAHSVKRSKSKRGKATRKSGTRR